MQTVVQQILCRSKSKANNLFRNLEITYPAEAVSSCAFFVPFHFTRLIFIECVVEYLDDVLLPNSGPSEEGSAVVSFILPKGSLKVFLNVKFKF